MTTQANTKIQPKNVLNLEKLGPTQLNFLKFALFIKDPLTNITAKGKTEILPKKVLNLEKLGPV